MTTKKYMTELPREEVTKMLQYPSELWSYMYEIVAEHNGMWAGDTYEEILGKDNNKWVEYDSCSYDWWINVKSGHYKEALDIDTENYFSDDDRKELEELRAALKQKCDAIDDLENAETDERINDDTYWERLSVAEEQAEELANKMLKIVEREIKSIEEVTDDQIVDEFIDCEYGDDFYILNGDNTKVYRDYTKCYKVTK